MIIQKIENLNNSKYQLLLLLQSFCLGSKKPLLSRDAIRWSMKTGLGAIALDNGIIESGDDDLKKELTANKLFAQFWFQSHLNCTKQLISQLNEAGIRPTLLKGISISTNLYPQAFYRTMGDIDILLDVADVKKTEETLAILNFEQRSSYSSEFYASHHHTMPWHHIKDDVSIEVHHNIFSSKSACFYSSVFQSEIFRNEKLKDDFYGLQVHRFSYEFQIVYIASHWGENFKLLGGLFALVDIALILNKNHGRLDWEKIILWANAPYVSNYVYLLLRYLSQYSLLHSEVKIDKNINCINHTVGGGAGIILNFIINNYLVEGRPFGRIFTRSNVAIIWQCLLEPKPSLVKVLLIPFFVVFPQELKYKFNIRFQWSRFVSIFTKQE